MERPLTTEMHIDVHTLRYFLALANEGTMRKAANALHVTQPTLSRQIGALEQSIGKPLYERKSGRVHLTQEGRLLYRYAEDIVELADRAAIELSEETRSVSGHVSIACAESVALEFIADCIKRVRAKYPGVVVDVMTGSPLEWFEKVDSGVVDFLLEVERPARAGFNHLMLPAENHWVIAMPAGDPMAKLDVIHPSDLAGKQFVCSRLALRSGVIERWAGEWFDQIDVSATFNLGTYLITMLAKQGVGYALTYQELQEVVRTDLVEFRPVDPPIPVDRSMITWKKYRTLNPACLAFLEEVQAACEEATS